MVLVVGATGLLGLAICERLRARGKAVRALVRPGSTRERRLLDAGCSTLLGDLKDAASLACACQGVDAVVTTANAFVPRRQGDSLRAVDHDGTLALVKEARSAGVRHFVYTSASPVLPPDNPLVRYKREVEAAVRASGMTWTILQPSAFMEIHTGPMAGWDFSQGRARIMGSGRAPASYISVSDVAAFATESVLNSAASNRALHIAGPEPITALDAVRIAERVTGRSFRVQRLPATVLALMSVAVRPFNASLSSLFRMGVALDRGEVVDMGPLVREFLIVQTTFEEYVRRAVAAAQVGSPAFSEGR